MELSWLNDHHHSGTVIYLFIYLIIYLFIYLFIYFSEMKHSTYARYISTIKIWVVQ